MYDFGSMILYMILSILSVRSCMYDFGLLALSIQSQVNTASVGLADMI